LLTGKTTEHDETGSFGKKRYCSNICLKEIYAWWSKKGFREDRQVSDLTILLTNMEYGQ
jgi:hypothetical protein